MSYVETDHLRYYEVLTEIDGDTRLFRFWIDELSLVRLAQGQHELHRVGMLADKTKIIANFYNPTAGSIVRNELTFTSVTIDQDDIPELMFRNSDWTADY